MKRNLLILIVLFVLVGTFTLPANATFTTGRAQRTFKIESFRVTPKVQLRGFLLGFGINNQSSLNIKLTQASEKEDADKPAMNFIIPSFEKIKGYDPKTDNPKFYLDGPIVNFSYQYIPKNRFFITPNSLNGLEIGLRHYTGKVYNEANNNEFMQNIDKTYLMFGLLSRSRWDNYNLFSEFKFSYDMQELGGWIFDSQAGLEYKFKENIRLQLSYRAMASTADSQQGINIGARIHY